MSARSGHERSDLPAGPAAMAIAGLFALIGIGALVGWGMFAAVLGAHPPRPPTPFEQAAATPASPQLEVDARADRLALERRAEARLAGYGWTDRLAGLAHIPIDRAMALTAAQGWPDADTPPDALAGPANAIDAPPAVNAIATTPGARAAP